MTFQTPTFGPVFSNEKNLSFFSKMATYERYPIQQVTKANVQLLKAYAGMDSFLLEQLAKSKCDGVALRHWVQVIYP